MSFNVGDLIVGKSETHRTYRITNEFTVCSVLEVYSDGLIQIDIVEVLPGHPYKDSAGLYSKWDVAADIFMLYPDPKLKRFEVDRWSVIGE